MPLLEESNDIIEQSKVENARVGYQTATSLWTYEGNLLWAKFNALLIANSIVLGSIGLAMNASDRLSMFLVGMPIMGVLLCVLWFLLTKRSFDTYVYWISSAREIEEKFLSGSVRTVSRGADFAEGKPVSLQIGGELRPFQMSRWGGLLRIRIASYLIIGLFFAMYLAILMLNRLT